MMKVLCPGEALIDFVAVEKQSLINSNEFLKKAGGAPVNAAGVIAKFGVESYFLGSVGKDAFGDFLIKDMKSHGINTDLVMQNDEFTTLAFVSLDENGERDFIFNRGADAKAKINSYDFIKDFNCIHFSSATAFLGDKLMDTYYNILEFAKKENIMVSFDANYREVLFEDNIEEFIINCKNFICKSDIVKLSEEEAKIIAKTDSLEDAGKYIKNLGCSYLIITLGSKGAMLFYDDKSCIIPSIKVKVKDTTGAGDAFIGAVIAQVVKKEDITVEDMKDIIYIANKIGAKTTENYGGLDSIPMLNEVGNDKL